jgi:hypothetical protein
MDQFNFFKALFLSLSCTPLPLVVWVLLTFRFLALCEFLVNTHSFPISNVVAFACHSCSQDSSLIFFLLILFYFIILRVSCKASGISLKKDLSFLINLF